MSKSAACHLSFKTLNQWKNEVSLFCSGQSILIQYYLQIGIKGKDDTWIDGFTDIQVPVCDDLATRGISGEALPQRDKSMADPSCQK